jgi:solute carrier family 38 (sodium-coupled neutral amino acid transporter), member 11
VSFFIFIYVDVFAQDERTLTLFNPHRGDVGMERAILVVSTMAIILPISMQRDMADLAKTSKISVIFQCFMVLVVVIFSPVSETLEENGGLLAIASESVIETSTIFIGLGVLSFAFVCQHSAFIVAGSLEKPTKERWGMATSRALSLCLVLEAACGIAGYLAFLEKTQGDVLNNFLVLGGSITKAANLARGLLCTTMFFVYPVDSFVCRHVLVVLFFRGRRAHEGDDASVLNRRDRRIAMTLIIYFSSLIPALFVESVGSVLALTGTIAGSSLSYIGPGMIYLAVYGDEFLKKVEEVWGKFDGSTDTAPAETDVESSRLLTTQQPNETTTTTESTATEQSFFKSVAWYLLLMPIWCEVAKMGKTKLKEFKEKEALKSPHINRLGKVARPSLQMVPANIPRVGSADGGKMPKFPTPKYGATAGGNKAIGAAILAQQRSASVRAASPAPADLDEPPTWYDFCVAIFFVVFGTIAMCAGMFSILTAK